MGIVEILKSKSITLFWQLKRHDHTYNVFKICKKCKRHEDDIRAGENGFQSQY